VTARILDGREVAAQILRGVEERVSSLRARGVQPKLNFVTIGEAAETQVYIRQLERVAGRVGIEVCRTTLDEESTPRDVARAIDALNSDASVNAVIFQLPLPERQKAIKLAALLDPDKDVDGITYESCGRLYAGAPGPVPSTAAAMMEILDSAGIDVAGKSALVIGRSPVVGHPVAELLLHRNATVTVAHRQTRDLAVLARNAEILMVGAGKPRLVTRDMVSPGAVIVDAGTNVTDGGLVGDVDFEGCVQVARAITPVPGGVGPVTNAVLLRGVVDIAERRAV
jgi:methylenetetrahydrofolate dehydrogenase (NADP+) / methenyltetrahydrofolate cyclohydrolase